jgi:outer membrane protein assembly complex protein YaeT
MGFSRLAEESSAARAKARRLLLFLVRPSLAVAFGLGVMLWATLVGAQTPSSTDSQSTTSTQNVSPNPIAPQGVPQAAADATPATQPQSTNAITNPRPALPVSIWSKAGTPVVAVRFDGVTFSAKDEIYGELQQKAGQPLDPEKVRADLRRLFASGRYRDIAVSGEQTGNGLTLVFAGIPQYYVGRVEIVGVKEDRLASLLEYTTKLDPGTIFTDAQIPAAIQSVKDSLAQNGYFQPTVSVTTTKDDVGHQVNARFTVATGPQARVGEVAVAGSDTGISIADFRKQGHLNCSKLALKFHKACRPKVTRETTSNALSGVRAYYQKENHLEGTISMQKDTYAPSRKQLDYDFNANQGPVVKVVVNGVKLSKSRTKLLVPVFEEGAVDIDLLNEGAFNIRDYLQQQGYFDVEDKVQLLGNGTKNVTVQYDVAPGRRHKVTQVKVVGNKYFETSLFEERLRVKKADAYQRSGHYSKQLENADKDSILALYRANGFNSAKVESSVKDIDEGPKGVPLKTAQIQVTFTIVEGPQQKFGVVELKGVYAARQKDVQALISAQSGQPFSLITLSEDRDSVLSYYVSHGFDHAKVEIQQNVEGGNASLTDVALNVTEGQQVFIDQVLLSGINHTRPSVVNGKLRVHAGDPLDQAALLQTQRNLYNLALFNEVNAAVQNPSGDAPRKNVLVQLTEARRWDVTYGFGVEAQTGTPAINNGQTRGTTAAQNGQAGISPRVSVDVSRINLRGTQDSLTLHATYGLLEEIATLSFNNPQFLGHPNLTASVSGGYSNVQNIATFSSSTLQGDARLTQKIKRADNVIYDFLFRRVSVNAASLEITPNLIPQLSEPVTVGGPGITFFHDTRDPTPLDAKRGQFFSIQEFLASPKFGSGTSFNRVDTSQSSYYTFGKHKYTFARNLRVAFENSFGPNPNAVVAGNGALGVASTACSGTLLETNASCIAVPLPERIYAGGATSHRGFGINDAGPRDLTTGFPVGGTAAVINSFELRLPPPTLPIVGDSVSFVVFEDMGNAFEAASDMFKSFKNFHQPNSDTCRNLTVPPTPPGSTSYAVQASTVGTCSFAYYSHAVGLGARYNTPVGPIRLDFSYNLNPPIYPVFNDYSGTAATDYVGRAPYVGQAGHFNFFFSIGQSF